MTSGLRTSRQTDRDRETENDRNRDREMGVVIFCIPPSDAFGNLSADFEYDTDVKTTKLMFRCFCRVSRLLH